ncbi:MAG: hypothetical protein ACI9C1_001914 [Candidatus Aldehydirespiratoraceae bacterium]|jgi:hypothetical protein
MTTKLLPLLLVFALFGASCSDDADPSGDVVVVDPDDCGQGQAFPDDPEFRIAICRPFFAMVELIGTDAVIQPEWTTRITEAILGARDDRAASMAALESVLAEIEAASP